MHPGVHLIVLDLVEEIGVEIVERIYCVKIINEFYTKIIKQRHMEKVNILNQAIDNESDSQQAQTVQTN